MSSRITGARGLSSAPVRRRTVFLLLLALAAPAAASQLPIATVRGQVYDVTEAELRKSMARAERCTIFDRTGAAKPVWEGTTACHSQGISIGPHHVFASCQDGAHGRGKLVTYAGDPPARNGLASATVRTIEARSGQHAAVGQGVIVETVPGKPQYVFPAVSFEKESSKTARIAILDESGKERCRFEETTLSGDGTLGASSLAAVDGALYLATCGWDCKRFFVYRLKNIAAESCGKERVYERDLAAAGAPRTNAGAGDATWGKYNAIAIFGTTKGELFLVGGNFGWLDTWHVTGFATADMKLRKIAKKNWGENQAHHGSRGMFYEGMALEALSPRRLAVWAFPHDYGTDGCAGRVCTRAISRCEKDLGG